MQPHGAPLLVREVLTLPGGNHMILLCTLTKLAKPFRSTITVLRKWSSPKSLCSFLYIFFLFEKIPRSNRFFSVQNRLFVQSSRSLKPESKFEMVKEKQINQSSPLLSHIKSLIIKIFKILTYQLEIGKCFILFKYC